MLQLLNNGLFLVIELSIFENSERFVQIAASFEVLCRQAEVQGLRFPLSHDTLSKLIPDISPPQFEQDTIPALNGMQNHELSELMRKRSIPFRFTEIRAFKDGDFQMLGYSQVKLDFLSKKTRLYLTGSILSSSTVAVQLNNSKLSSLPRLLQIGVYNAYYALHDNSLHHFRMHKIYQNIPRGTRAFLRKWTDSSIFDDLAQCKTDINTFPLDDIRDYFGEKIAFYFAWLSFYTEWFQYLAAFGVLFTIFGIYFKILDDKPLLYIFDNELTPIFGIIASMWTTLFLKFWKRRANTLSFIWDMDSYDEIELPRVQWKPTVKHKSPVTGKQEDYVPAINRRSIRVLGTAIVTFAFLVLCGFTIANIAFASYLQRINGWATIASLVASSVFVILQILLIRPIYELFAIKVNELENYKFPTKYQDRLVLKQFAMSFVNSFGLLFFSATIKPVIFQMNTDFKYFGVYSEICIVRNNFNSCLQNLVISIAIIFLGTQYLHQFFQLAYPFLLRLFKKKWNKQKLEDDDIYVPPHMKESELLMVDTDTLSWEYSSKVLQLAYVVLFSTPFPIASLFGWFANLVEIRLDLYKFLMLYKRPFAHGGRSIGSWERIVGILVQLGTLTNAIVISFLSSSLNSLVNSWKTDQISPLALRIAFVLVFEHVLLLFSQLVEFTISDIPSKVKVGREAERYIEKLILGKHYEPEEEVGS